MSRIELTYYFDGRMMSASEAIRLILIEAQKMDEVSKMAYLDMHKEIFKFNIMNATRNQKFSKIILPTVGVIGLVALIILVFFTPYPTKFQSGIIWITIAIVGAFCAAAIPGFFEIEYKGWIRAGGALAVFVLIYLKKPIAMEDDFSPKIYKLNLYVAKKDTSSIASINIKYEPNSSKNIMSYSQTAISEYYGENETDTFTCYRKSDGKIYTNEKCSELGSDCDMIVISNSLQQYFKNKREAYDHFVKFLAIK